MIGRPTATRRDLLRDAACGFGALSFAAMAARAAGPAPPREPRARRVIFLFMQGGVSQVDSFDYKPALARHADSSLAFDDARTLANTGQRGTSQRVMASPWRFARHGQSGRWASGLFPHISRHVDDLCFLHALHTEGVAHGPATLFLHCGASTSVRPSIGSWVTYGLGSENDDLPGFVTIAPSSGNGGARNYGSAFLPARFQGTPIGRAGRPAAESAIDFLRPPAGQAPSDLARRDLVRRLGAEQAALRPRDDALEAVLAAQELAWRMQSTAPSVLDLATESAETRGLYGLDDPATADFGHRCLLARRLCESGVRFVQVTYGDNSANPAWDQHSNLPKHADHARAVDRPTAGLLADLKRRGLLEDTLVWWGSEFGRTPYAEKQGTGRDHNPGGFTVWLAGGGVKPGFAFGSTDELGHLAADGRVHLHDLHATILHQLGLDHEQLTYTYQGRPFRLTDVSGRVVTEILA